MSIVTVTNVLLALIVVSTPTTIGASFTTTSALPVIVRSQLSLEPEKTV